MSMTRSINSLRILFFVALGSCIAGCFAEVPATNPFDPATPLESQKKSSIRGVVVIEGDGESASNQPKADAKVELVAGPTKPEQNPLTTDGDGAFEFNDLIPGSYEVQVSHPEHPLIPPRTIVLTAGEDRTLQIVLPVRESVNAVNGELNINYTLTGQAKLGGQATLSDEAQDHSGIVIQVRTKDETPTSIQMTTGRDGTFGFFSKSW